MSGQFHHPLPEQTQAADPQYSVWVNANAGSGKTTVLTDRILRILLLGTPPSRILCLTYTRAAAAVMVARVNQRLARWTGLSDQQLGNEIAALQGHPAGLPQLDKARRLFAHALETPGGLKIQTIHGFCERILHQFPFEANVPAHFDLVDDASALSLRRAAIQQTIREATTRDVHRLASAFKQLSISTSDVGFAQLIEANLGHATQLEALCHEYGSMDQMLSALATRLGLTSADSTAPTDADMLDSPLINGRDLTEVIHQADRQIRGEEKLADLLTIVVGRGDQATRSSAWQQLLFTAKNTPRKRIISARLSKIFPDLADQLAAEQQRLHSLFEQRAAHYALELSRAFFPLLSRTAEIYAQKKYRSGKLDYADLIEKVETLLTRAHASSWVLYKLDGGIDHILVDEAQDTSAAQWRIIRKLSEELIAGEGRERTQRSLFVVGDEKQSIYSFQGADPNMFDAMRRYFDRQISSKQRKLRTIPLLFSFRSAPAILETVDKLFAGEAGSALTPHPAPVSHAAFRRAAPGYVEIWPIVETEANPRAGGWQTPLDRADIFHPAVLLAEKIADNIQIWTQEHAPHDQRARPGDILVLVQRRRPVFIDALIRALRQRDIPVSGTDRLRLSEHIAVLDILALCDMTLLPDDDLNLACVLRSPLIGLSEEDLFQLAHGRAQSLWCALADRHQDPTYADAYRQLCSWRNRAIIQTPFAFLSEVMGPDGQRHNLQQRLGSEAGDVIDALLDMSLEYERIGVPSLQGFVHWMRGQQVDLKRDLEQSADEVRIMTVHGAKGQEAPIIILPDCCSYPDRTKMPKLVSLAGDNRADRAYQSPGVPSLLAYCPGSNDMAPPAVKQARDNIFQAQLSEYNRLLYVAMTRAKDRLYIAGYKSAGRRVADNCWYRLVEQALSAEMTEAPPDQMDGMRRYQIGEFSQGSASWEDRGPNPEPVPIWAVTPALPRDAHSAHRAQSHHTPSGLADRQSVGETEKTDRGYAEIARKRGQLIHHLLEHLPQISTGERAQLGRSLANNFAPDLSENDRGVLVDDLIILLDDPECARLFSAQSYAELPISGIIHSQNREISFNAVIDRLHIDADRITIIDIKSDLRAPNSVSEVKPSYLRQLAAYRALIHNLYPNHSIECVIVWTENHRLMPIPPALISEHTEQLFAQLG